MTTFDITTNGDEPHQAVTVLDREVRVVGYRGHRVVTFRMVDELHDRVEGTAARQFRENRDWFREGLDFFELTSDEIRRMCDEGVLPPRTARAILLTERGYGKVTKGWSDDRSRRLFDAMQDAYFAIQGNADLVAHAPSDVLGLVKRVDGISRMLARKVTGIEAIVGEMVEQAVERRIAADARVAVLSYVSVRQILDELRVPTKRRRSLQAKIFRRLVNHCLAEGLRVLPCPHSGTKLFPRHEAVAFVRERCGGLIHDHVDRVTGQGRLQLIPGGRAA